MADNDGDEKHDFDEGDDEIMVFPSVVQPNNNLWVTDFSDNALSNFYREFSKLEMNPALSCITVFISSFGGEVNCYLAMRDLIRSSSKPVATVAIGKAMSAGAALLAAGTKGLRFAGPNTEIMIHEISSWAGGKNADIKNEAKNIERINKKFLTLMAEDMGISFKDLAGVLKQRSNTDWYLTAKEAQHYGLIDWISIPRLAPQPATIELMNVNPAPLETPEYAAKKRKGSK